MKHRVHYHRQTLGASPASGTTYRFVLPRVRPLNALCIRTALTLAGSPTLVEGAPEGLISRLTLRAGKDVIVDLEGHEAWLLSSFLGVVAAPKFISTATAPESHIIIPFGQAYALVTKDYTEVTVEITIGAATRVSDTAIDAGTIDIYGIEQDEPPTGVTRRFLRSQDNWTGAGEYSIDLPRAEAYRAMMLVSYDALTAAVVTKDAALNNITSLYLATDLVGARIRPIEGFYTELIGAGLYESAMMELSTAFITNTRGVLWHDMTSGNGAPFNSQQASDMKLIVTHAATGVLGIVRDVLV